MNRYFPYTLGFAVGVFILSVSMTIYLNWLPFLIILVTAAFPISWLFVFQDIMFGSSKPYELGKMKTRGAI